MTSNERSSHLINSSNEGSSLPACLSSEEHQIAPSVGLFRGLNVPANSTRLEACESILIDSTTREALGVDSQLPLYHNNDMGYFFFVDLSNSRPLTASTSTAGREYYEPTVQHSCIVSDICNSARGHVSIPEQVDDDDENDEQRSQASSYSSSTVKPIRAAKGCGKEPSPRDMFNLQAMRGDGKMLKVHELRSVLTAMGKVILGWDLTAHRFNWNSVKALATAYGADPDRLYDPNNRVNRTSRLRPNKIELLKMFTEMKTIIDAICKENPNHMDKYYRAAALAEENFAASIQVHDCDLSGT